MDASSLRSSQKKLSPYSLIAAGRLVRPATSSIGVGKVVSFDTGECIVEFFHSVSRAETRKFRSEELTPVHLTRQTRCYVREPESQRWVAGRIGARDGQTYEVNFPDKRFQWIDESDIYVRCNAPVEDP